MDILEPKESWCQRWLPFLRWSSSSPQKLKEAEEKLLSRVRSESEGSYVEVELAGAEEKIRIWTRKFAPKDPGDAEKPPLVMVHGMGSGLALFALSFDQLTESRSVYAIDLPGFARSSRFKFSGEPIEAEDQYVRAIEGWREKVGLGQINLLGHSFGGYLSAAYALKFPQRVSHLILADPWGFPKKPDDSPQGRRLPAWARFLYHAVFKHLNPLASLRAAGPFGQGAVARLRGDLVSKFRDLFDSAEECTAAVAAYIYHCNAHTPTGESAFHSLMEGFAWAKFPMLARLAGLDPGVPVTALYGAESWIDPVPESDLATIRNGSGRYNKVILVPDAGHHVYANAKVFNDAINEACDLEK